MVKNGRGRALLFLATFHFPSPISSFPSSPFEIYPSVSALSEFPLLENETAFLLLIHGAAPVFVLTQAGRTTDVSTYGAWLQQMAELG